MKWEKLSIPAVENMILSANPKYSVPKWLGFCLDMLKRGYAIKLHRAKTTRSKYLILYNRLRTESVKVRFSDHRPSYAKQSKKDSDYYVGVSNGVVITTDEVKRKIIKRFENQN